MDIEDGILSYEEGKMCAQLAREKCKTKDISKEDSKRELRTEAEAALYWAYNSPSIPSGRYAVLDIGAGTADASICLINEKYNKTVKRWQKSSLCFFGEYSYALGMDAIDESLKNHLQSSGAAASLRGKEEKILKENMAAQEHIRHIVDKLYEVLRSAFGLSYQKQKSPDVWKKMDVVIMGGGSLISVIRNRMKEHPYVNNHVWDAIERQCDIRVPEMPEDLYTIYGERLSNSELPFILIAYGLSLPLGSIPYVDLPSEVDTLEPSRPPQRNLDHEDIYLSP